MPSNLLHLDSRHSSATITQCLRWDALVEDQSFLRASSCCFGLSHKSPSSPKRMWHCHKTLMAAKNRMNFDFVAIDDTRMHVRSDPNDQRGNTMIIKIWQTQKVDKWYISLQRLTVCCCFTRNCQLCWQKPQSTSEKAEANSRLIIIFRDC